MTTNDYVKAIEAALAMDPTPGPLALTRPSSPSPDAPEGGDYGVMDGGTNIVAEFFYRVCEGPGGTRPAKANAELYAACNPVAMRALLEERKALRELLARAAGEIAGLRDGLGSVVGGSIDPTEVERDIKAALTTAADSQKQPKGK